MQESAPLYAAPWWLDATCGRNGWEVYAFRDEEKLIAVLPYQKTSLRGMPAIINPYMSQWLPILRVGDHLNISLDDFFNSLPSFSILDVSFKPEGTVSLSGQHFPVNSRYSYLIDARQSKEQIRSKYNAGLRRNLREAEKKYTIRETADINTFLLLCHSTYRQRKMKSPIWLETVPREVYKTLMDHQRGRLEVALLNGKPIAGIMTAWDKEMGYYLLGGRTRDDEGISAHAFLLDHAIAMANGEGRSFDFEGSMHPGIAVFFQSFGAVPTAYWQIKKFKGMGKIWSILHK